MTEAEAMAIIEARDAEIRELQLHIECITASEAAYLFRAESAEGRLRSVRAAAGPWHSAESNLMDSYAEQVRRVLPQKRG